jgi:hypothetical protein
VLAKKRHRKLAVSQAPAARALNDPERRPFGTGPNVLGLPIGFDADCERLDAAERLRQQLAQGRAFDARHEQAAARDHVHEAHERGLHGGDVRIDVGVVVLHVVDDGDVGHVVDELGPLVEKRCVVFVAFDHEVRPFAEAITSIEIDRHAADEEAGVDAGVMEDERQEARRRGLAVCPRHDQRRASANEGLGDERRQARVTQPAIEHGFHLGIPAREGVADHDEIDVRGQVGLRVRRPHRDAEGFELGGHWRIDVLVRTGHGVAVLT